MSRLTTRLRTAAAALTGGLLIATTLVAGAQADPPPIDGSSCSASQLGQKVWSYSGPWMNIKPVITDQVAINIAPGTTGTRTDTLTEVETVTRSVTNSVGVEVSASAEAGVIIAKVSTSVKATYNYTVVTSGSTSTSKTTAVTWSFNQPGYYGLYRGVQQVSGYDQYTECIRYPYPSVPIGWKVRTLNFNFFTSPEEGTILCTGPATTLPDLFITKIRDLARKRLGDC
ncbi:hypothetical protein ACIA49_39915 [Kribbella sp. NPDC051587]|uniref:hypothetical protein n=1 Tax=Kribbella sp. NPDC051587 TaxID=3364119 RepID=UPI0037BAFCCF